MMMKCPKCKSKDVLSERWLYAMTPNTCQQCGFKWEQTEFFRLFLPVFLLGLLWLPSLPKSLNNTVFGAVIILGYLSLILVVPSVLWFFKPYQEWGENFFRRRLVNFTAYALLGIFGIFGIFGVLYLNA